MLKKSVVLIAVAILTLSGRSQAAPVTLAQWTFETSVPTTAGPHSPELGSGAATINTEGTISNPAGWGSIESFSSNGWDVGEYFQFQVSTLGFQDLQVGWQHTGSNTGPANFNFQYSTDGSTFAQFGSYSVTNDSWNTTATPEASVKEFDLSSVTDINNQANVYFRLTMADNVAINTNPVASTGTSRVDNFTVTAVPEPSSLALLSVAVVGGLVARRLRKNRSGAEETMSA